MMQHYQHSALYSGIPQPPTPPERAMPKKRYGLPKGLQNKPAGSENWYQLFYDKHRQPTIKWVRLDAHDLTGAKIERDRLLRAYEIGLVDPWEERPPHRKQQSLLLADAVDAYLGACAALAEQTRRGQRSVLTQFIGKTRRGQRRQLRQITTDDIGRFIDEAKPLRETTRRFRLRHLSAFFSWCIDQGHLEENPATAYRRQRRQKKSRFEKAQAGRPERRLVSPDEFRALESALQLSRHSYLVDVFQFALATGLRRGELFAINRRDVSLGEPGKRDYPVTGHVQVRSWDSPGGERFRTKSGRDRIVPLCPLAAQIAHRHLSAVPSEDPWRPLFVTGRGARYYASGVSKVFTRYRREVHLPDTVTFHSLRHSFASYLLMLGVNLFSIKRLLGHARLDELVTYAELCEPFLMGDARPTQRRILELLCPGIAPDVLDQLMPTRRSMASALSDARFGAVQSIHAPYPMTDVLFGGVCYDASVSSTEGPATASAGTSF